MFRRKQGKDTDGQQEEASGSGPVSPADLELESLYEKFRAPFDQDGALSAAPQAVRDWLGKFLWRAMIAGSSVEAVALDTLTEDGLRPDQVELLRKCYRERMRPRISESELARIRKMLIARGGSGSA